KVHKGLGVVGATELDAQALGAAALEAGHDGVDDVGRERGDKAAEGQPDRNDDDVAAQEKVLETPHAFSSDSLPRTAPGMAGAMPRRGLAGPADQAVTAPEPDQKRRTIPVIMTGR